MSSFGSRLLCISAGFMTSMGDKRKGQCGYSAASSAASSLPKYPGSRYDEAYIRLQPMLAFCGQRSLLPLYSFSSFAMARLLLHMSSLGRGNQAQLQAVAHLLSEVDQLVSAAGYVSFQAQCRELLARVVAVSNE